MGAPILVAGIGNLFLGDDGFGPEVVRRLMERGPGTPEVRIVDYGIRGMHLAFDLLDDCAALILVDLLPVGSEPGAVTVLEVGADQLGSGDFDAHGMNPVAVLSTLGDLGGELPPTYLVGCRPLTVEEGIGLSTPVEAAVPEAVAAVTGLVARLSGADRTESAPTGRG